MMLEIRKLYKKTFPEFSLHIPNNATAERNNTSIYTEKHS